MGIDQPLVGTSALTPFSFLTALPLSYLEPLTAKRVWTVVNILLAAAAAILLQTISRMKWIWIALLFLLCLPLHTNIVLGQMYLLLLSIMVCALWLYLRGYPFGAGLLIGIAAGLKIFPLLFLVYFLRKRDWRASTGALVSVAACALLSAVVFGRGLIWEYITQQLPCAMRGESLDPYVLSSNSISSVLHRLFVFEPQLNPAPAFHAPWLMAVLLPILQALIFAPALLFDTSSKSSDRETKVEWAVFTLAILTISTFPASYHFTVLLMPVVLLLGVCTAEKRSRLSVLFCVLFALAGVAMVDASHLTRWQALIGVPRLYLLVVMCVCGYSLLEGTHAVTRSNLVWSALLIMGCVLSIVVNLQQQRSIYDEYAWRIPIGSHTLLARDPIVTGPGSGYSLAMQRKGYAVVPFNMKAEPQQTPGDELSFAANSTSLVVEKSQRESRLIWKKSTQLASIENAHDPVLTPDNSFVAFIRDENGRGALWMKSLSTGIEQRLVDPTINVLDVSIAPKNRVILSSNSGGTPKLFIADQSGHLLPFSEGPDRYPSVSPDGRWLAFSRFEWGAWNLWIQDLQSGSLRPVTRARCNQITPSWEPDSRTLVYASDCGRGLLLTALVRQTVIPYPSAQAILYSRSGPQHPGGKPRTL